MAVEDEGGISRSATEMEDTIYWLWLDSQCNHPRQTSDSTVRYSSLRMDKSRINDLVEN